jgi:hypothetical protein
MKYVRKVSDESVDKPEDKPEDEAEHEPEDACGWT